MNQSWKPDTFGEILDHLKREGVGGIKGLFRRTPWQLELGQRLVIRQKRKKTTYAYGTIREVRVGRSIPLYRELIVEFNRRPPLVLHGLKQRRALELRVALDDRRAQALVENFSKHILPVQDWVAVFRRELSQDRWFTRDMLQELLKQKPRADRLKVDFSLILKHPKRSQLLKHLTKEDRAALLFWEKEEYRPTIDRRNARFGANELKKCRRFFDAVERSPLTEEQRKAVICFDNRVLVVAAAGSGKTSTMVAKAGYAVQRGIVKPEEILMLAFNKSAAKELDQRVTQRLGAQGIRVEGIRGSTFHALGLGIIGQATGRKPRLARFIDQGQERATILRILQDEARKSQSLRSKLTLLRYVFIEDLRPLGEDEQNFDAWDAEGRKREFQTLKGENVKSQEERTIADWLHIHGIDYRYEHPYEIEVADASHGQYLPDFYYPEIGLYHEHFALDADGNPPDSDRFYGYLESVRWKRELAEKHKTSLFETTSAGIRSGDDFNRLLKVLRERGLEPRLVNQIQTPKRLPVKEKTLARTLHTFLSHVKSNRLTMADLRARLEKERTISSGIRHRLFLDVFEAVWTGWQQALAKEKSVDFDDMLNEATDHVRAGHYNPPYRLILVDEFQDVTRAQASLLHALTAKAHFFLFAVGDDWQSINRFAGADISVMTGFHDFFGEGPTLKLQRTFRCPQSLADLARRFVSENPAQIDKEVRSSVPEPKGESIQGFLFEEEKDMEEIIENYITDLYKKNVSELQPGDQSKSLFVLGRYKHNRPEPLADWRRRFKPGLRIGYSTIHSSKGLEADFVCIAPMNSGTYGFPSTIEDDPVLLLAMPHADQFPFAEERRLFYVALTRARESVALFAPRHGLSQFLATLVDWDVSIEGAAGERASLRVCSACKKGQMVPRDGPFGPFLGCDRFPRCRHTQPFPNS